MQTLHTYFSTIFQQYVLFLKISSLLLGLTNYYLLTGDLNSWSHNRYSWRLLWRWDCPSKYLYLCQSLNSCWEKGEKGLTGMYPLPYFVYRSTASLFYISMSNFWVIFDLHKDFFLLESQRGESKLPIFQMRNWIPENWSYSLCLLSTTASSEQTINCVISINALLLTWSYIQQKLTRKHHFSPLLLQR